MKKIILATFVLICTNLLFANNVKITNVALKNDSTLTFKVSWENSWRIQANPGNHDAVWIFIKWEECAVPTQWNHLKLKNTGYYAAPPLEAKMPADRVGLMVQRSGYGNGNIVNDSVAVQFNLLGAGAYNFRVFGIEMVYVPQDSFYLGDLGYTNWSFCKWNGTSNFSQPYLINSDTLRIGAITTGNHLGVAGSSFTLGTGVSVKIPNTYPNGYSASYCMKYEITRAEWVAFLNTITSVQANTMLPDFYNQTLASRNYHFRVTGIYPAYTTDYPFRAADGLDPLKCFSYLDWCGLRPMTELEFEKFARGRQYPVPYSYPWGNTLATQTSTFTNWKTNSEKMSNTVPIGYGAIHCNRTFNITDTIGTTIRGGFNGSTGSTRLTIGAGYWGILELAGNQGEAVVPLLTQIQGAPTMLFCNRFNKYSHGDGSIAASTGYYNDTNWVNTFGTPGTSYFFGAVSATTKWRVNMRGGKWCTNLIPSGTVGDSYQISYRGDLYQVGVNTGTNVSVHVNTANNERNYANFASYMTRGVRTANF
ncbi:MAG: hypothetical protein JNL57_13300 [Bacteroidetes bacterium]|nr:hypothetical protein [Bacteroidota bacterium]